MKCWNCNDIYTGWTQTLNNRVTLHKSNCKVLEKRKRCVFKHFYECSKGNFRKCQYTRTMFTHYSKWKQKKLIARFKTALSRAKHYARLYIRSPACKHTHTHTNARARIPKHIHTPTSLKLAYRGCPWCSRYRRRKWTRRHEFKSWTRLIAFHIALIPLGKVWIQLFSLQLWVNSRTD